MQTKHELSRRDFLRLSGSSAAVALLAACAAPGGPAPGAAQSTGVEIEYWQYPMWDGVTGQETAGMSVDDPARAQYTPADWPNWAAEQFAQEHPDFSAKVEIITWEEGRDKLTVAATTGQGRPHVFLEDGPIILRFAKVDAMVPVELSDEDKEDFFPGAIDSGTWNGQLWYRPWLAGSRFLLLNRAIFREQGVEDLIPTEGDRLWTFEEFLEAAQATTFTRDSGEEVFGWASHFGRPTHFKFVSSFIWGRGASIFDESGLEVVINSPEAERGLQFLYDLQNTHHVMPPGSAGLQSEDVNNMFYQGRLAMMMGSHGSARAIRMAKEDGTIPNPDAIDIYPVMYPAELPDHQPAVFTIFMGFGHFDTGSDAEKEMAAQYIEFLTNTENAKAPTGANLLPVRKSSIDVFEGDEFMGYAMQAMNYTHPDILSSYFDALGQFIDPMYQAVLSGRRTPAEALQEAQERGNEFIEAEEQAAQE